MKQLLAIIEIHGSLRGARLALRPERSVSLKLRTASNKDFFSVQHLQHLDVAPGDEFASVMILATRKMGDSTERQFVNLKLIRVGWRLHLRFISS